MHACMHAYILLSLSESENGSKCKNGHNDMIHSPNPSHAMPMITMPMLKNAFLLCLPWKSSQTKIHPVHFVHSISSFFFNLSKVRTDRRRRKTNKHIQQTCYHVNTQKSKTKPLTYSLTLLPSQIQPTHILSPGTYSTASSSHLPSPHPFPFIPHSKIPTSRRPHPHISASTSTSSL